MVVCGVKGLNPGHLSPKTYIKIKKIKRHDIFEQFSHRKISKERR
jgi:hypothetical protein